MRLTLIPARSARSSFLALALSAVALALSPLAAAQAPPAPSPAPAGTAPPQDVLGNMVVTAGSTRALPKIAVVPSLSSDLADVTLRSVVVRDLDLCGEFEVLPDSAAPDGVYASDATLDMSLWAKKGVEAVVKVTAKTSGDSITFVTTAYLVQKGATPVFTRQTTTTQASTREESHRTADLLIGALTGQNGGFASRMTFTSGTGQIRSAYVIDADGHDPHTVSPKDELAIGAAFGKNEEVHWIASVNNGEYRIASKSGPALLPVKGSVYGLAFSRDRSQVAVSIGARDGIKVFLGPDFAGLKPASPVTTAIEPAFTPSGKLAFAGAGQFGQRIYVDGKPISPPGVFASSPTFCNHPDGVKAVFAAGAGKTTDLVVTGESGGGLARLTQNQGGNSAPACSPDGRLVAFFSTRTSNEGPGLYIMRVDGLRPKRVSTLVGDTLHWDPLPPAPAPAPAKSTPAAPPAAATKG